MESLRTKVIQKKYLLRQIGISYSKRLRLGPQIKIVSFRLKKNYVVNNAKNK